MYRLSENYRRSIESVIFVVEYENPIYENDEIYYDD